MLNGTSISISLPAIVVKAEYIGWCQQGLLLHCVATAQYRPSVESRTAACNRSLPIAGLSQLQGRDEPLLVAYCMEYQRTPMTGSSPSRQLPTRKLKTSYCGQDSVMGCCLPFEQRWPFYLHGGCPSSNCQGGNPLHLSSPQELGAQCSSGPAKFLSSIEYLALGQEWLG